MFAEVGACADDAEDAHVLIYRPSRHNLTTKGRTKSSYAQSSCASKFHVGSKIVIGTTWFLGNDAQNGLGHYAWESLAPRKFELLEY